LVDDFTNDNLPDVVFVEPLYQDDPRRGSAQATDDHAPASLYGGQRFLKVVHEALTANPSVWNRLVAVITYDEHGSLFDHVPPPALRTDPSPGSNWKGGSFDTLGVRVPAIVLCPFVQSGSLYEGVLDHTSILKFLGDLYGNGSHSESVDSRRVGNLADVLDDDLLSGAMPLPSLGPIP
jgi:phospholipase C